jgi:hypothetical protein
MTRIRRKASEIVRQKRIDRINQVRSDNFRFKCASSWGPDSPFALIYKIKHELTTGHEGEE